MCIACGNVKGINTSDFKTFSNNISSRSGHENGRLDTNKKLVRTSPNNLLTELQKSQDFRLKLYAMRRTSATYKTDSEFEKKYTSVSLCGVVPIDVDNSVTPVNVVRGLKSDKIFYNGLLKCGSVWRCPVCNFKITSQRQKEIYWLTSQFLRNDKKNKLSFITFTMRHRKGIGLKYTLDVILDEFRKFQRTSVYKRLKLDNDIKGIIKSLEITYSDENGWHPHLHILFFHQSTDINQLHKELVVNWVKRDKIKALKRAQKAIEVFNSKGISDYVTKWDMSKELTKGSFKLNINDKNKIIRYTPFKILKLLSDNAFDNSHEQQFLKRRLQGCFAQYVDDTKGKHMIHISKNLVEYINNEYHTNFKSKSEKDILENEKIKEILFKIDIPLWKQLSKKGLQPIILNNYESFGLKGVLKILNSFGMRTLYNKKHQVFFSPKFTKLYNQKTQFIVNNKQFNINNISFNSIDYESKRN